MSIVSRSPCRFFFFFFNDTATTEIYPLSLHDALPISAKTLDSLPGVRIWGRCFTSNGLTTERPLAAAGMRQFGAPAASGFDIAMFHGSREGQCPPGQVITAPFTDAEAQAAPFAYLAVGHYHAGSR